MEDRRARVAELYRRHAASVHRRARSLLGNEAEAREVLQELFLTLLEQPEQFAGRSAISTFLYSATTHACLNRIRNQKNRARLLSEQAAIDVVLLPAHPSPDVLVRVREALAQMPTPLAEVAVYYFMDELSQQEIATILACSRRHVGHLIERLERWGREHAEEDLCSA